MGVDIIMMGILIPNRQHKKAHHLVSLVRLVFDERREQLEHGLSLHTHHTHLVHTRLSLKICTVSLYILHVQPASFKFTSAVIP